MPTVQESTTAHVRRAVCHHEFTNSFDWAGGLDALAGFTDAEIDALAQDEPSDPIIFEENVPLLGITPAHRQDRLATDMSTAADRGRRSSIADQSRLGRSERSNPRHASSRTLDQEERAAGVGVGDS